MKRIVLDLCCLKRPYDDQTEERIRAETETVYLILREFELGRIEILRLPSLLAENEGDPDFERMIRVQDVLMRFVSVKVDLRGVVERAMELAEKGMGAFDALHLASAEEAEAEVFLTVDDRLVRKAALSTVRCRVMSPTHFIFEEKRK